MVIVLWCLDVYVAVRPVWETTSGYSDMLRLCSSFSIKPEKRFKFRLDRVAALKKMPEVELPYYYS